VTAGGNVVYMCVQAAAMKLALALLASISTAIVESKLQPDAVPAGARAFATAAAVIPHLAADAALLSNLVDPVPAIKVRVPQHTRSFRQVFAIIDGSTEVGCSRSLTAYQRAAASNHESRSAACAVLHAAAGERGNHNARDQKSQSAKRRRAKEGTARGAVFADDSSLDEALQQSVLPVFLHR